MNTTRPDWLGEYPDYETIVTHWGYDVLNFETFGCYQGDHLALLEGPEGVGIVVIGYGSCSGCDELQSITPWDDDEDWRPVIDLADTLRRDIHWEPDFDAMKTWLETTPESRWWSYDDEMASWLNSKFGTEFKVND